jgi:hypothetical protein
VIGLAVDELGAGDRVLRVLTGELALPGGVRVGVASRLPATWGPTLPLPALALPVGVSFASLLVRVAATWRELPLDGSVRSAFVGSAVFAFGAVVAEADAPPAGARGLSGGVSFRVPSFSGFADRGGRGLVPTLAFPGGVSCWSDGVRAVN